MGKTLTWQPEGAVDRVLCRYLGERLGIDHLSYRVSPIPVANGWETYTYRLQLSGRALPRRFRSPLKLRVYAGDPDRCRIPREFRLQRRLAELGYPVPRPVLLEEDANILGGAFLLSEWQAGETLLDLLRRRPLSMWWAPSAMAEAHVRLHRLPVEGLQPPRQPFLDRSLEDLGSVLADCGLRGLGAGYRWLADHRPLACEPPSLLHLDFHPDNVVMRQGRCQAVLDWSEADVGDRHADIGATLFLIEAAPVPRSTAWQDGLVPLGRWILRRRYLRAYRRLLAVDDERVRFYRAWAALRRLATYGCWLRSGPRAAGYQPEALARLHRRDVAAAEKYFHRWTGVSVRLGHTRGLL